MKPLPSDTHLKAWSDSLAVRPGRLTANELKSLNRVSRSGTIAALDPPATLPAFLQPFLRAA